MPHHDSNSSELPATFLPPGDWLESCRVHGYAGDAWPAIEKRHKDLFDRLHIQIENALPASLFDEDGLGAVNLARHPKLKGHLEGWDEDWQKAKVKVLNPKAKRLRDDWAGIYVFVAENSVRPFYVGITRTMCRRLRQHLRGKEHNTATLLYAMLCGHAVPESDVRQLRQEVAMDDERAREVRVWLERQRVAILPIACPIERYVLEVYAAVRLQTGRWNTFETH